MCVKTLFTCQLHLARRTIVLKIEDKKAKVCNMCFPTDQLHTSGSKTTCKREKLCVLVLSLQELCCRAIVARTTVYSIEQLPLPSCIKSHLKSYALTTSSTQLRYMHGHRKATSRRKLRFISTPTSPGAASNHSCVPRNSCSIS